jgi:hypothetical protein
MTVYQAIKADDSSFASIRVLYVKQAINGTYTKDEIPPVITLISPTQGETIEAGTKVVFEVTDDVELAKVGVNIKMGDQWEVAYDGTDFAPNYSDFSTKTILITGFRFSLGRKYGWHSPPEVQVFAVDTGGNVT